jgi:hypothetical protein
MMLQKLDTVGGLVVTHVAVGVAGWLLARGWVTSDQAADLVAQAKANWLPILIGLGGAGGAVTAKVKSE